MWKWIALLAAVPLGAAATAAGIGAMLPRDHMAAVEELIAADPGWTARMIREVERHPEWRSGVRSIRMIDTAGAAQHYVEHSGDGEIRFRLVEERPERLFRSTIADPNLPFGGSWLFSLEPEAGGTRVRIEEHGFVGNVIFRFVARFIFGHERNLRRYMADLRAAAERRPSVSGAPS